MRYLLFLYLWHGEENPFAKDDDGDGLVNLMAIVMTMMKASSQMHQKSVIK